MEDIILADNIPTLRNVFYVYIKCAVSRGCTVTFRKDCAIVHQDGEEVLKAQRKD